MKKAIIIYQSKKGTTRKLGNDIGRFLEIKGINTEVVSLEDYDHRDLSVYEYVFLGCWTKGLMVIAQHPDKTWKKFVKSVEIPKNSKICLFTTYKIATGTMFSQMRKSFNGTNHSSYLKIKSKNGSLSNENARLIDYYVS
jgi:flavodoxin